VEKKYGTLDACGNIPNRRLKPFFRRQKKGSRKRVDSGEGCPFPLIFYCAANIRRTCLCETCTPVGNSLSSDLPRMGMRLPVHVQHPARRDSRVDGGRFQVLMPKLNCDHLERSTMIVHMRSTGMAQCVRIEQR
jgi:hypothetical protein